MWKKKKKTTKQNLCCEADLRHLEKPAIILCLSDDLSAEMHRSFEHVGLICDNLLTFFGNTLLIALN
jgi:hypothetical protein